MPRSNPPETIRKLLPGSVGGDRAVQPGVHMTPTANGVRIASVGESPCIPDSGAFAESFDKADGLGWGADLSWTAVYGLSFYFPGIATLDGAAAVDTPAPCTGRGLFSAGALAQVQASLTPDQIVEVTFIDYTPTWTGGDEYENRLDLLARACVDQFGQPAWYNASCLGAGGGPGPPFGAYLIQKVGAGGNANLATDVAAPGLDPGDVMRFEVVGNSLVLKINGSTVLSCSGDDPGETTGPALNPDCSSSGLGITVPCVDVTAPDQGPFGGAGGWATLKADDFSVVAS